MQLAAALMRFASLQRRAAGKVNPAIVSTLIMELERSLHEVETACEELKAQSDRLAEERDALAAVERRYRDLFDFAPVPYIITDESGIVTSFSDRQITCAVYWRSSSRVHERARIGSIRERTGPADARDQAARARQRARDDDCARHHRPWRARVVVGAAP
jgi:PAS domain-containing protein